MGLVMSKRRGELYDCFGMMSSEYFWRMRENAEHDGKKCNEGGRYGHCDGEKLWPDLTATGMNVDVEFDELTEEQW